MAMIESFEEFEAIVAKEDEASRARLRNDTIPAIVWTEVIENHPELKRALTLNKTLEMAAIRLLAADADPAIRCDMADLRRLPTDLFETLANDEDESVRARIAWNKKTPEAVLRKLAEDSSPMVSTVAKEQLKSRQ